METMQIKGIPRCVSVNYITLSEQRKIAVQFLYTSKKKCGVYGGVGVGVGVCVGVEGGADIREIKTYMTDEV